MLWHTVRRLAGMKVVVIGVGPGSIGQAVAARLAAAGSSLVLVGRDQVLLDSLRTTLGDRHRYLVADISNPTSCEQIVDEAYEWFGRVDTIICCAGQLLANLFERVTWKDAAYLYLTNHLGPAHCFRYVAERMQVMPSRDGYTGHFIHVSSACARRGVPFEADYAATKAANDVFFQSIGIEAERYGIAVTCVYPRLVKTPFFKKSEKKGGIVPTALMGGHYQTPDQVAEKIVRAIKRPPRSGELWPEWGSRLQLTLSGVTYTMRCLTDWVLRHHYRDRIIRDNGLTPVSQSRQSPSIFPPKAVPQSRS